MKTRSKRFNIIKSIFPVIENPQPLKYDINIDIAPPYMTTPDMIRGYRVGGSYKDCIKSMFRLHNETFNAVTILLASIEVSSLVFWAFNTYTMNSNDMSAFIAFLLAYVLHAPFSIGYHTFIPINSKIANHWRKLDIYCIFLRSILFSYAFSYFVFSTTGVAINVFCQICIAIWGILTTTKIPDGVPLDKFKQAIITLIAICCYTFPIVYIGIDQFITYDRYTSIVKASIGCITTFVVGGSCYAFRIPDRLSPGTFDIVFNSHVAMHVGICILCIFEFLFMISAYQRARLH